MHGRYLRTARLTAAVRPQPAWHGAGWLTAKQLSALAEHGGCALWSWCAMRAWGVHGFRAWRARRVFAKQLSALAERGECAPSAGRAYRGAASRARALTLEVVLMCAF